MKRPTTNGTDPVQNTQDFEQTSAKAAENRTGLCPVVGIGASAGGIEALISLFDAMPAESGIAFLVVMHLDPTRDSRIADVLSKHSAMTVSEATDGKAIEPNHVYVIPPATSLTLQDGHLRLTEPTERRGARYPINELFASLANVRRSGAICIVLSGTGNDGTEGLKQVRSQGGCIIVQDPSTARFGAMPRSAIAADLSDHVLAPAQMPDVLLRYSRHSYAEGEDLLEDAASGNASIDPVLAMLKKHAGQDFRLYKRNTLTRRIHRRMSLCNLQSISAYLEFLASRPDEIEALGRDLMINVTGFFRDPEAWAALDETVLTPLVAACDNGSSLRLWVPACATGEEAYTLAMLVGARAETASKQFEIKVFATDGREDNLTVARAGIYSEATVAPIPPHLLVRYFDRMDEGSYRVVEDLRAMVVFAAHNLLRDPPFSRIDLISCRNLLIYLQPVAQKRALALMHFALRPGGYLLVGNSEGVSGRDDLFKTVSKKWRIFRRIGSTRHDILDFPLLRGRSKPANNQDSAMPEIGRPIQRIVDVAQRALLERFAPASVLIESNGQIVWIHGSTGDYLEPPPGEPSRDLIAMARYGLRAKLRYAVREVIEKKRLVDFRATIRHGNHQQAVAVSVTSLPEPADGLLLVSFRPFDLPPGDTVAHVSERHIMQQAFEDDLATARAELKDTIQQFEATNEELKAANEEVTSMNEELQSTNEELETSKEELQAFNEELQTVNSQLQEKNQELADTTDTLNNLLASSEIATVFLDKEFRIKWFSPRSKELLALVDTDVGRPVAHFAWKVLDEHLLRDAETVLQKLTGIDAEVRGDAGRWYLRRVLPYRTQDDRIAGVVIAFVDITDQKRAQDAVNEARLFAEAIINTVRHPVLVLDSDLRVRSVNPAFCEAFNCVAAESENHLLQELDHGAWDVPELRQLLHKVLSDEQSFDGFEIEHVFPKRGRRHMLLNARKLADRDKRSELILLAIEDVTERHEADVLRQTLINELSHRVKNMLAMVQSIGSQTLRQSETLEEFEPAFEGRLHSLARVHDLLFSENWTGADLGRLVRCTMEPLGRGKQIAFNGPKLNVTPEVGVAMAMVLNELATNAVKYGALSRDSGHLKVAWRLDAKADGKWVALTWTETGGPTVTPPTRKGFGSTLIERSITHQLNGTIALHFRPEGLCCDIAFPWKQLVRPRTVKAT